MTEETKTDRIERAIDKTVTKELTVYGAAGALNIAPQSMSEMMGVEKKGMPMPPAKGKGKAKGKAGKKPMPPFMKKK